MGCSWKQGWGRQTGRWLNGDIFPGLPELLAAILLCASHLNCRRENQGLKRPRDWLKAERQTVAGVSP